MVKATDDAKEKAKKAIEEMKVATQGSSEETKGSEWGFNLPVIHQHALDMSLMGRCLTGNLSSRPRSK